MDVSIMDTPLENAQALFRVAVRRVQADRLMPEGGADPMLETAASVRAVGMGKAAMAMAGVWEEQHPDRVDDGVVVVPEGYPETARR
jgi:hydroxypyruvate reductase